MRDHNITKQLNARDSVCILLHLLHQNKMILIVSIKKKEKKLGIKYSFFEFIFLNLDYLSSDEDIVYCRAFLHYRSCRHGINEVLLFEDAGRIIILARHDFAYVDSREKTLLLRR